MDVLSGRPPPSFVLRVLGTVVLFLFAIRLLGAATDALSPFLGENLGRLVVGDRSALGVSWIASYVLANGTVVAALALSLFTSDLVTPSHLFFMIVGSRLGASAVVVFVGAVDYVNEEAGSLRESTSLGLLAFLLTHSVYLPALVLGYVSMPLLRDVDPDTRWVPDPDAHVPDVFSMLTGGVVESFGAGVAFLLAIGFVLLSMRSFDRILDSVDKRRLRRRYLSKMNDKWVSFVLGLVFTGLTTSVAFSLGIFVPLYNRGHVERDEIVPYVLGANVGTLVDTLVVAIALDTAVGVVTVLVLLSTGLVVSLSVLVLFAAYTSAIDALQDEIVGRTGYFVAFLVSLLVVPLLLVVLP